MSEKKKKLTLLELLKKQDAPVTLPQLLEKLGTDYADRTVRRWLTNWIIMGLVHKTGQKRGTRYFVTKDKLQEEPSLDYFSPTSQHIITQIKTPYALRKPVSYNSGWLDEYRPNIDSYLPPELRQKLYRIGNRSKDHKPAGTYARQIYNRLLIDLSYNSSRLEGNTYSLLETKQLLMEGIDAPGKLNEEKTMLLNHKEAIQFLVDKSDEKCIEETTIYTLHYLLSDGLVSPGYAGKIRDHGVRIGGSTYIPLENPERLRQHLDKIRMKANQINDPYETSIFLLAHIAYLQAFVDVNKRTARLSANIPLIYHNLVPLSFDDVKVEDYTSAMIAIYELNNINPLIDLYLHSYFRTAQIYDATVEAIGFDRIRVLYRQQRREIVRTIIINNLHGDQINKFIQSKVPEFTNPDDQRQVIRNIHEDLEQLEIHTIAGLGITSEELNKWLKKNNRRPI